MVQIAKATAARLAAVVYQGLDIDRRKFIARPGHRAIPRNPSFGVPPSRDNMVARYVFSERPFVAAWCKVRRQLHPELRIVDEFLYIRITDHAEQEDDNDRHDMISRTYGFRRSIRHEYKRTDACDENDRRRNPSKLHSSRKLSIPKFAHAFTGLSFQGGEARQ